MPAIISADISINIQKYFDGIVTKYLEVNHLKKITNMGEYAFRYCTPSTPSKFNLFQYCKSFAENKIVFLDVEKILKDLAQKKYKEHAKSMTQSGIAMVQKSCMHGAWHHHPCNFEKSVHF